MAMKRLMMSKKKCRGSIKRFLNIEAMKRLALHRFIADNTV
jgi:hypothetical protein